MMDVSSGSTSPSAIIAEGLPAQPWTKDEDELLLKQVGNHGQKAWSTISCGLANRSGKACKERWMMHIGPMLKAEQWSEQDETILLQGRQNYGEAWHLVAKALPGRSEATCKIHWEEIIGGKDLAQRVDDAMYTPTHDNTLQMTSPRTSCDGYYAAGHPSGVGLPAMDDMEAMETSSLGSDDSGDRDGSRMSSMFGPPRPSDFFATLQPSRCSSLESMQDKSPPKLQLPTGAPPAQHNPMLPHLLPPRPTSPRLVSCKRSPLPVPSGRVFVHLRRHHRGRDVLPG